MTGPDMVAGTISWPLQRTFRSPRLVVRGREFHWGARTFVMGVINATPDSFSGDGTGDDHDRAAALARAFEAGGADLIDLGAASSRPGGDEIGAAEEARRLLPALAAVRAATSLPISIDTWRSSVAEAALEAGGDIVNDIHGFRRDPAMAEVVARFEAPAVVMHNQRGRPFHDVITDIREGLDESLRIAVEAGIDPRRLVLDPGFGFGWTVGQNLEMLRRLPELWPYELPLLVGVSRKSTLGEVTGAPVDGRREATAAAVALSIATGADVVRVHDAVEMTRVARMADAVVRATWVDPA